MISFFEISDIYSSDPRTLRIGSIKVRWPFPITYMLGSSAAKVFGRSLHGSDNPFWVKPVGQIARWAYDAKWRFRHRYIKRYQYHIIRPDLEPGYYHAYPVLTHDR